MDYGILHLGCISFSFFFWLWSLTARTRGRLAADVDIQQGRYQVLGYGFPVSGISTGADQWRYPLNSNVWTSGSSKLSTKLWLNNVLEGCP
jgi:hypothetical protein